MKMGQPLRYFALTEPLLYEGAGLLPTGHVFRMVPGLNFRREGENDIDLLDRTEALFRERQPLFAKLRRLNDTTTDRQPNLRFKYCVRDRGDGIVDIDMPLARAQRLEETRVERNRRLAKTDWQALRAYEQGLDGVIFAQTHEGIYRQKLRDIPQTIDLEALTTPEALEAFEPDWAVG